MTLQEVQAKFADSKEDSFLVQEDPTQGQSLQVDFVASTLDLRNARETESSPSGQAAGRA